MTQSTLTEEEARVEAQRLARKIGDGLWKQGQTIRAFQAYRASNLFPTELLKMNQDLQGAARISSMLHQQLENNNPLASEGHKATGSSNCDCLRCQNCREAIHHYGGQIRELLGWDDTAPIQDHGRIQFFSASDFERAALECLLLTAKIWPLSYRISVT